MTDGLRDRPNVVPGAYRGVSVTQLDGPLDEASLRGYLLGREVYRRTRFVVALGRPGEAALARVEKATEEPLFAPVTEVELLAGPDETVFVEAPDVDTAVPSELARVAVDARAGARAVVVQGQYQHISFILNPDPVRVLVQEVVPPEPAKLVDQVRRLLAVAEDLPPMVVEPDLVSFESLAAQVPPADRYLLPCRGSGVQIGAARVAYLDERPARQDWTLLGCARSRELHRWFYGDEPVAVDSCPRGRGHDDSRPVLTKCCLLEASNAVDGRRLVVPWGASLEQVRAALGDLARTWAPAWRPA